MRRVKQAILCTLIMAVLSSCGDHHPNDDEAPATHVETEDELFAPDTLGFDKKALWNRCIQPMCDGDSIAFAELVQFPLMGEWGYVMELDKPEELWNKQDFIDNWSKLINDLFHDQVCAESFENFEVWMNEGVPTVDVAYSESFDGLESAVIFRFQKVRTEWTMVAVFVAG